jgi:hypothetical protein
MPERQENYAQDRTGDVHRQMDEVTSEDGMVQGEGLITLTSDDTPEVVYEVPEDATKVHIVKIEIVNRAGGTAEVLIEDSDLDDQGNIQTPTLPRTPSYPTSDGERLAVEFRGEEVREQAITAQATTTPVDVGVAVQVDHREYTEPASDNA